jgi:hypothetical protein
LRANDRAYPAINSNDVGQQIQIVRPRVAIAERKFTKSRCAILIVVGLGFLAHCRSARPVNAAQAVPRFGDLRLCYRNGDFASVIAVTYCF